jgi:biotin-dependent carboxylase-like uncharacterized protein
VSLRVLKSGLLTTVQDAGRFGHRHLGVGGSGAADGFSFRAANLLVQNRVDDAALEITLSGPTLTCERALRIALCGADCDAWIDGMPIPGWRALELPCGATLRIGACRRGARAYLALGGGLAIEPVLGSCGTDLRAGIGGWKGRALQEGDVLPLGRDSAPDRSGSQIARAWIDPRPTLDFSHEAVAQVLPGRDALSRPEALFDTPWRIAAASDRQGLRLEGAALALATPREMISEPLVPGTIQLPPQGGPIVLLADAQTVGGYPVIGTVASADLPRLAQCRPGDTLHLRSGDVDTARRRLQAQSQHLARIAIALSGSR